MKTAGFLTLGQSPRPDLIKTFAPIAPDIRISVRGGLDHMSQEAIQNLARKASTYKLLTVCQNNQHYEIGMEYLIPLLEKAGNALIQDGADPIFLMCAGRFPSMNIPGLISPYKLLESHVMHHAPSKRIGVVTPNPGQKSAANKSWTDAGFIPRVIIASPFSQNAFGMAAQEMKTTNCEMVILDCMGFSPDQAEIFQKKSNKPTICPQVLIATRLQGT